MKKIQVDFCNRKQTGPERRAFSRDLTINLSQQCRAFSRALKTVKSKAPLLPVRAGTTNKKNCIKSKI